MSQKSKTKSVPKKTSEKVQTEPQDESTAIITVGPNTDGLNLLNKIKTSKQPTIQVRYGAKYSRIVDGVIYNLLTNADGYKCIIEPTVAMYKDHNGKQTIGRRKLLTITTQ